jgi:hypothetical protein
LGERGYDIRFLRGDTDCPHPFATRKATSWIRKLLSSGVGDAKVLLVVFSEETLESEWVRYEVMVGSEECTAIVFLALDGLQGAARLPSLRYLPSCPVYAIDFSNRENGVDTLGRFLAGVRASRGRGSRNRAVATLAIVSLCLMPGIVYLLARSDEGRKLAAAAWSLVTVGSIGAGFALFPSPYPARASGFVAQMIRLRGGFSSFKFIVSVSLLGYFAQGVAFALGWLPPIPFSGIIIPVGLAFLALALVRARKASVIRAAVGRARR